MNRDQAIEVAARAVEQFGPRVVCSRDEIPKWAGQAVFILQSVRFYEASDGELIPDR